MAVKSRDVLKTYFETGDYPTQEQFWDWLDSFVHINEDAGSVVHFGTSVPAVELGRNGDVYIRTALPHTIYRKIAGLWVPQLNAANINVKINGQTYNTINGVVDLGNGYLTELPAHTHPLSHIAQSGATNGQVPSWNGSAWVPTTISTSNIYNSNGTLTGNRQLTLGGNSLSVLSGSNTAFHLFPNGRVWFGNGTPVDAGFQLDVIGNARIGGQLNTGVIQFSANNQILQVDNDNYIQLPRRGGANVHGILASSGGIGWRFVDNGYIYSALSAGNGTTIPGFFYIREANASFGVNSISFISDFSLRLGNQSTGESLLMLIPNMNQAAPGYAYRPSLIVQAGKSGLWVGADNFAPAGHLYLRGGDANNTGTNVSGGNIYVQSGRGTGTGTGGDIIMLTTNAAPSGTTLQTLEERVRIKYNTGNMLIGTSTDVPSSILTLASTTKGFLPPRMTGAQAEAIASPAEGLLVYVTTGNGTVITSKGWWGYDGTTWVKLN